MKTREQQQDESKTYFDICRGMSAVCKQLARSEKDKEKVKELMKRAEEFEGLGKLFIIGKDNPNMIKGITMIKKQTPKKSKKQEENILVHNALEYIRGAEKQYGIAITKRACSKYVQTETAKARLNKEIRQAEANLEQLKKDKILKP